MCVLLYRSHQERQYVINDKYLGTQHHENGAGMPHEAGDGGRMVIS
jgi:hypothetical protein